MSNTTGSESSIILQAVRGNPILDAQHVLETMGWSIVKSTPAFSAYIKTIFAQSGRRQMMMCTKYGRVWSINFGRCLPPDTQLAELNRRFEELNERR
jgi:hypothetical protein